MAGFADGKWHAIDAIAKKLDVFEAIADATLKTRKDPPHQAKVEFKIVGVGPHCRIFHADRMIRLSELKEKFGPIIEELKEQGKTNAATVSIAAVKYSAHRLQQIIDEWKV